MATIYLWVSISLSPQKYWIIWSLQFKLVVSLDNDFNKMHIYIYDYGIGKPKQWVVTWWRDYYPAILCNVIFVIFWCMTEGTRAQARLHTPSYNKQGDLNYKELSTCWPNTEDCNKKSGTSINISSGPYYLSLLLLLHLLRLNCPQKIFCR